MSLFKILCYFIMAALSVSACSSIPKVSSYAPSSVSKVEEIQNYVIGQNKKIFVGESIIEKGYLDYEVISEGKYKAIVNKNVGFFSISKGKVYSPIYSDIEDGGIYIPSDKKLLGKDIGVKIDADGYLIDKHLFYHNPFWQGHTKSVGIVGDKWFENVNAKSSGTIKYSFDSYKYEIIYLGLSGEDIKASFREYKDDIARPAFFQDLTYNLQSNDIIRYKNFRIRIVRATNEYLEYIVLSDKD